MADTGTRYGFACLQTAPTFGAVEYQDVYPGIDLRFYGKGRTMEYDVIARAGASTVAELAVLGRPSLLVPYAYALDNDQLENATRLQQAGGAWCFPQAELTNARLADEIVRLLRDPKALGQAAEAARSCGKADAVEKLADLVEELTAGR